MDGDRTGSKVCIERSHSSGDNGTVSQGYSSRGAEEAGLITGPSGRHRSSPSPLPLSIDTHVPVQIPVHTSTSASITTSGEPIALSSPVLRVKPRTLHLTTTDLYRDSEVQSEPEKAAVLAAVKGGQMNSNPLMAWHSPSLRSSPTGECCHHYTQPYFALLYSTPLHPTLFYCIAMQHTVTVTAFYYLLPHPLPATLTACDSDSYDLQDAAQHMTSNHHTVSSLRSTHRSYPRWRHTGHSNSGEDTVYHALLHTVAPFTPPPPPPLEPLHCNLQDLLFFFSSLIFLFSSLLLSSLLARCELGERTSHLSTGVTSSRPSCLCTGRSAVLTTMAVMWWSRLS